VQKTFAEGAQDFNFETGDRMYRLRTTPIHDEVHGLVSVIGNFDDITERNRLQAELRTALAAAQDASNAKSDFLANMSHEMRTPLNAVIGLSELTLCSDKLAGECYSNLEKINNAGVTLLNMVNDILDISKIESGKFQLIPVDYDTPSLLNDTINQSILYIGEKPIDFILNIDQNLPLRLYGDDLRIKQILNNLLSNAFKYTAEGKVELSVHCERDGSAVWFTASVADSGIGIRKEDIGNLFKDYAQMDIRAHRKIVGTGLGLPITKKIIDIMNGSITVESEYGKGSIFTVRFPQQYVTDEIIGADIAGSLKNFSYSDQKRRTNSRMTRMRLPYANVLVVDDVATNLDVAKGMMKPYGMKIDCVLSGQEAIDAIRDEKVKYNAVFMDHMMPEMDGIEAVRRIREEIGTEYSRTIPIIALTANAIAGNEEMFLSKGFQAFISKPVETEHLDAVIREFVRDRKQEEALGLINVSGQMLVNIRSGSDRRICINRRSGINRRELKKASPWIDIDRGIQSFGGDRESYMQVLRSFASATRGLLDTVRGVNNEHLANYAIAVHGIKGSSRSVHIKSIGDRAEALEKAAKEGNFGFVSANNGIFADELEKLLDNLDDLLGQIDPERPKPKKDKPDTKALERLQAACTAYDMDEVDAAMSEIESFEYNSDNGLALWLRENVDQMNFTEITEKLPARSG
ncbi:MAG: ATP-binding protein, partial [Treponema sp.]|nr:ATP-binding protein [Treponema sp.]